MNDVFTIRNIQRKFTYSYSKCSLKNNKIHFKYKLSVNFARSKMYADEYFTVDSVGNGLEMEKNLLNDFYEVENCFNVICIHSSEPM